VNGAGLTRIVATVPATAATVLNRVRYLHDHYELERCRVLLLGDSFTFGLRVKDDETFARRLEEDLRGKFGAAPVEVVSAGVLSYCPLLEYLQYRHHLHVLEPDLVVLNFDMSDVQDHMAYSRDLVLGSDGAPLFDNTDEVPDGLRGVVTPEQARERWRALAQFHRRTGHFLVTAGPYQVGRVTAESATLPVFRDFTYPLGVGSFDQYAIPTRAFIRAVERRGDRLAIQADVENVEKAGRSYKIVREPFTPAPPGERTREPLTVHWTVVGPGDDVVAAGASRDVQGGRLVVDLAGRAKPGAYRVMLALALNGNLVNPEVTVVAYRVAD